MPIPFAPPLPHRLCASTSSPCLVLVGRQATEWELHRLPRTQPRDDGSCAALFLPHSTKLRCRSPASPSGWTSSATRRRPYFNPTTPSVPRRAAPQPATTFGARARVACAEDSNTELELCRDKGSTQRPRTSHRPRHNASARTTNGAMTASSFAPSPSTASMTNRRSRVHAQCHPRRFER